MNTTEAIESLARESADKFAELCLAGTGKELSVADKLLYRNGFIAGLTQARKVLQREMMNEDNDA